MLLISMLLVVFFIFLLPAVLSKIQNIPMQVPYSKPNVIIDLNIIHSDKFKNLIPFGAMPTEFVYTVTGKNGKQITGNISAGTIQEAQKLLEASGFKIISLKTMDIGRSNPFVTY